MGYKYILRTYLIGWFVASIVWYLIRISTIEVGEYISTERLAFFTTSWLFQGFLYGTLFYFITSYLTQRVKFYQLLGVALLTQLIIALVIVTILFFVVRSFNYEAFPKSFVLFMTSPTVVFGTIYSLIVNALISITMSISLILGQGMLKYIITGKYYEPRKERRIFMFIDLRDSTKIAEKLGHLRFSKLIQDCFYELSIFNKYKGQIYKYVGDEAIITWPTDNSVEAINSLQAFYAFTNILQNKSKYFKSTYNVIPSFKAGIHVGNVTVTEIGKTKREIAYLGDTVNTTARIQGECNRQKSHLLLSEDFKNLQTITSEYTFSKKGSFMLRGKNEPINLYTIN